MKTNMPRKISPILATIALVLASHAACAAPIYWTDWTSAASPGAIGTLDVHGTSVGIAYTGIPAFVQTSGGADYWQNYRGQVGSPYTSATVDNMPPTTDIVGLNRAGPNKITFTQSIANPLFAYVSLNGNGYGFDQDFDILSFGDASNGNYCGYWGCGTSYKQTVVVNGVTEYQLLGTGEPHGVLQFRGAFATVNWRSLSNEYWNGFTVGVMGLEADLPALNGSVPEPATLALLGLGLAGIGFSRKKKIG